MSNSTRIPLTSDQLHSANTELQAHMGLRLAKHGRLSFIGPHEAYGILAEEFGELLAAITSNNQNLAALELLDIAVAAQFALASMRAHQLQRQYAQQSQGHQP